MNFLESVGLLSIIIIGFYLLLRKLASQNDDTIVAPRERPIVIDKNDLESENSDLNKINKEIETIKANLLNKYGQVPASINWRTLSNHSNKCTKFQLTCRKEHSRWATDAEQKEILNDPIEYWRAMENYLKHLEAKENSDRDYEIRCKTKIEYYLKFAETVFDIFDTKEYLTGKELLKRIELKMKLNKGEAENLIQLWDKFELIYFGNSNSTEQGNKYSIHPNLEFGLYESLTKVTRKEWIRKIKQTTVS